MADRFDRFSEATRRSLTFAHEEARALGHDHIDTGHLLLGLLTVHDPLIEALLDSTVASDDRIREYVGANSVGSGPGLTRDGHRMIELGINAFHASGLAEIEPGYLFLGILQQPDCVGAAALTAGGGDVPALTAELERRLSEGMPATAPPRTANEAIEQAGIRLDRRGRTQLIPDLEARTLVIDRLLDARKSVEATDIGYAKLIGTELLLPEIHYVLHCLESGVSTLPEFLERVGEVRHARATLERLAQLYQRADEHRLSEAASRAAAALQVASPLF